MLLLLVFQYFFVDLLTAIVILMIYLWFDVYFYFRYILLYHHLFLLFFFKQKTAYEMRISDWSSDVCSSDLLPTAPLILPLSDTAASCSPWRCRRATTLAISLPTVVGDAVWPWVRESIGSAACSCAIARSASISASCFGSSTSCRAWLSISA